MKTGIIIVFNSSEEEIPTDYFIKNINELKDVKLCLVNNNKSDIIFDNLLEISEKCQNVSVVNIRKIKTDASAVRAGARYMFNQFNLKYLGFIVDLNMRQILDTLNLFSLTQNDILTINVQEQSNQLVRKTYFQSLFSLTECLKKLKSVY